MILSDTLSISFSTKYSFGLVYYPKDLNLTLSSGLFHSEELYRYLQ